MRSARIVEAAKVGTVEVNGSERGRLCDGIEKAQRTLCPVNTDKNGSLSFHIVHLREVAQR